MASSNPADKKSPSEDEAQQPSTPVTPVSPVSPLPSSSPSSPVAGAAVYAWKGFTGDLCIQSYPMLTTHKIRSIAAGGGHVLFLTTKGLVYGRGHNFHGQLGLGEELAGHAQGDPQLITALADHQIVAVGAGRSHSAAVTSEGQVFCWGDSTDGQCGTGSLSKVLTPTEVKVTIQEGFCEHGVPRPEIPVAIESIACGATHTLALSVDDEIWTWGCGEQLGLEELLHAPVPRRIEAFTGRRVLMVACGDSHSLALVQKQERVQKTTPSPVRHRNVSKEAIITQKLYPSLCARCNQEIYTYTETNDTCIIDTDHVCNPDASTTSFESSVIFSDDEPQSSLSGALGQAGAADESLTTQDNKIEPSDNNSQLEPNQLNASNAFGSGLSGIEIAEEATSSLLEVNDPCAAETEINVGEQGCGDVGPSSSSIPSTQLSEGQYGAEKTSSDTAASQPEKEEAASTSESKSTAQGDGTATSDDVFHKNAAQEHGSCGLAATDTDQTDIAGDFAKLPVHHTSSVESDGEVWKRQSASDEKHIPHFEERVTSLDRTVSFTATSTPSRSRTPSSGSIASISKLKVDENQAREYLARQLEEALPSSKAADVSPLHSPRSGSSAERSPATSPKTGVSPESSPRKTVAASAENKPESSETSLKKTAASDDKPGSSSETSPKRTAATPDKEGIAPDTSPKKTAASVSKAEGSPEKGSSPRGSPKKGTTPPRETTPQSSSWQSWWPMEKVKTMTSRALTNIQTTMDSLVGAQNMELGDMSARDAAETTVVSSGMTGQLPNVMTDSNGSLEFGLDMHDSQSVSEGRSSVSPPSLHGPSSMTDSSSENRQSLRTLEMKQQNLERRTSSGTARESESDPEPPANAVIVDTEVWAWGDNQKGQLGLGDSLKRNKPVCIKILNSRCVLKLAAGAHHSLALTSNSQVYSWGSNTYGQLGHSENGVTPSRIKFMRGSCVWDIAAGTNHSIFLADSSSMKPDVYYCGKQPGKQAYSTMQKAPVPTAVSELKKVGYLRAVTAGGDNCYCQLDCTPMPAVSAVYELASSERAFYQELVKINTTLLKPLTKSSYFTVMDVFPYKSCLHNLASGFVSLTKKVGEGIVDLTELLHKEQDLMSANCLRSYASFVEEFRRYSHFFADFLAVGGFEYCARSGSEFFDKYRESPARSGATGSGEDRAEQKVEKSVSRFRSMMQFPFFRLKEYSRLLQKMAETFPPNSDLSNLLQKAAVSWDSLKLTVTSDHKLADTTRAFWEGANPRLADALRIPSRRVMKDSKTLPLLMPTAGRFSSHLFILFNDMFVHLQANTHTIFRLETLWVETPVADSEQLHPIVIISPEDRLELSAASSADKAEWLMMFNSAINKVLSSQKETGRRGSTERLSPPLARHATHTYSRHPLWKDGTYSGTWLSGKMHGHGEIKWSDGRRYTGMFKHGLQHGHGVLVVPRGGTSKEIQDGNWKDGKLNGMAHIRYANGDDYKGYFKNGQRFGHGVLEQGRHLSSSASTYVGEWLNDKRHGYGVEDDILKGEKYMGMWVEDHRHGNGIMVTLDGMYFEGNFCIDKLAGFGLMLTDDNSCYEGEFMDITQLSGKGVLTLPTGDKLEGTFNGSWNEGLKISGTFIKCTNGSQDRKSSQSHGIQSKYYGNLSVPADKKWDDIFLHCRSSLGHGEGRANTAKAWEIVAVAVSSGRKQLKEMRNTKSAAKAKMQAVGLEQLETIPPLSGDTLTVESYASISQYLRKAFDTTFHPLGQLMESLVDVFRAAYVGVGAHPRLLQHAVSEVSSYIRRIYQVVRILFPQLPSDGGPLHIYPQNYETPPIPTTTEDVNAFLEQHQESEYIGEIVTAAGLLYPILLPKIYPPLFDLYALYNDRDDDRYWERVTKLNRQGDMALMAFLGIDQKFWLMDDILLEDKEQKLSSTRDVCYASAVDALQQISTAFSPIDKLQVIEKTFNEITQTVQSLLDDSHLWCMDELFPIFQFVVVRAKIRHLGAEISMIDDLMERHMEHGELGIMFTMLKASFFQIQNEKMPTH